VNEKWTVVRVRELSTDDVFGSVFLDSLERKILEEFPGSIRIAIDASNNLVFAAPRSEATEIRARIAELQLAPDDGEPSSFNVYRLDGLDAREVLLEVQRMFPDATMDADDTTKTLFVRAKQSEQARIKAIIVELQRSQERRESNFAHRETLFRCPRHGRRTGHLHRQCKRQWRRISGCSTCFLRRGR